MEKLTLVNKKKNTKKPEKKPADSSNSKEVFSSLSGQLSPIELYALSSPASFSKLQKKEQEKAAHMLDQIYPLIEESQFEKAYALNEKLLAAFPDLFLAILNKGNLCKSLHEMKSKSNRNNKKNFFIKKILIH